MAADGLVLAISWLSVTTVVAAERVGAFLVFRDQDGLRHAVRLAAVLSVSDSDCDGCSAVVQLTGSRTVVVHSSLDEVLRWLC